MKLHNFLKNHNKTVSIFTNWKQIKII